jgi:hypothetical protein
MGERQYTIQNLASAAECKQLYTLSLRLELIMHILAPGVKSSRGYLSPGKGTERLMKLLLILQGNTLKTNTDKFENSVPKNLLFS